MAADSESHALKIALKKEKHALHERAKLGRLDRHSGGTLATPWGHYDGRP